MKIFFDTNIFLDAYLNRKGAQASATVLTLPVITEPIITIKTIFDIVYFLENEFSFQKIKLLLLDILSKCNIQPIASAEVYAALVSSFTDFEDAVQYHSIAGIPGINGIITRNKKDFRLSTIPVYTPEEFLKHIHYNN